jgi:hypothetical protein
MDANALAFILILIIIGFGLFYLFDGDDAWHLQEWGNRNRGIPYSERTPEWETQRKIGGVGLTLLGIVMMFILLTHG